VNDDSIRGRSGGRLPWALAVLFVAGCSGDRRDDLADATSGLGGSPTTGEADGEPGDDTALLDVGSNEGETVGGDGGTEECPPQPSDAVLEGTVFAPNMELPISGALVYLTDGPVEPIPDGTYCAECVELECGQHFALTEPDGSFSLNAAAGPGQKLVVHKGQFMRVVDVDVAPGTNVVSPDQSNLPGVWNPAAGMWIPRIAVYQTEPDKVYNVLAKFGLGQVDAAGRLVPGTESFTLINDNDQGAFMDDLATMSQYHIVFVPCAATKYWAGAPNVPANRIQNIRDYVAAGGKWYATDHSNEYIQEPFPNYQQFHNPGMPDLQPAYDSLATVLDPDLLAWLDALPAPLKNIGGGNPTLEMLPSVLTRLNYSGIDAVHEVIVQDDEGEDVNVGHHVWVEGPCGSCNPQDVRPMAITGQYGCGRMMYSTFETSSTDYAGLNPQELVLLYIILEIGVCFGDTPPPPPPVG
jgi:hypothetical protein